MRNPPTVERDRDQHHPPRRPLRPPHPHLAQYLADGDELLEDERLCVCGALEGDHLVVNDTCPRTGCFGFEPDPSEDVTAPGVVLTYDEASNELDGRSDQESA